MVSYDLFLSAFAAILLTIEPPGIVPLFLALTAKMTDAQRKRAAILGAAISYGVLIIAALCGNVILNALGISIAAFRVGGGLLLLSIAYKMVFGEMEKGNIDTSLNEQAVSDDHVRNIATFPLAIPLISGPGAISTTIVFSGKMAGATGQALLFLIITACMAITYGVMVFAQRINSFLDEGTRSGLTRIIGILLAAMAVQIAMNGFVEGLADGSFGRKLF